MENVGQFGEQQILQPNLLPTNWGKNIEKHLKIVTDIQQCTFVTKPTLHKKWSFPLRVSSVNVTKIAGNCEFSHIYCRNP